ncbi:MAG TPA: hypothetical protein VIY47_13560, partial [Ignavibacteriaceae bacterium]
MATKKSTRKISGHHSHWPKPIFSEVVKTNKNYRSNYQAALMYAHYELTAAELKKETIKYLKILDPKHEFLDRIKDINENRFSTIGKYMYILNHSGNIPDDILGSLMPSLE